MFPSVQRRGQGKSRSEITAIPIGAFQRAAHRDKRMRWLAPNVLGLFAFAVVALADCEFSVGQTPDEVNDLVAQGEGIFFNETFDGYGRTCGTSHRTEDSFGLSRAFIAGLPPDDPPFVTKTNPDLAEAVLVLENQDGFGRHDDSIEVLTAGGPHPDAAIWLEDARTLIKRAAKSWFFERRFSTQAVEELEHARDESVEEG